MAWQDTLAEARTYAVKGTLLLFKRAVALKNVFENEQFRKHCIDHGKSPEVVLDEEVADLCCNFRVLMRVLKANPGEHSWRNQRFDKLVAETIASERKGDDEKLERTDWKGKYLQLQSMYDDAMQKIDSMSREITELKKTADVVQTVVF